jgi:hypothetical protein
MKSILVFSHEHNTFDKRKLLENPHPQYFKESTKKVEDFIRKPEEAEIKDFFMNKMSDMLENYEPGKPFMKPDVLKQIKEIEEERKKMEVEMRKKQVEQMMQQQQPSPQIVMEREGLPPIQLNMEQTVELLKQQQEQIKQLVARIQELEQMLSVKQIANT